MLKKELGIRENSEFGIGNSWNNGMSSLFTIYSPILISRACRIILGDAERKIRIRENSELGLEIREIMWWTPYSNILDMPNHVKWCWKKIRIREIRNSWLVCTYLVKKCLLQVASISRTCRIRFTTWFHEFPIFVGKLGKKYSKKGPDHLGHR